MASLRVHLHCRRPAAQFGVCLRSTLVFCGASFKSKAALDGHRGTFHGIEGPKQFYIAGTNACHCCLVKFSNRKLLTNHMRYNTGYICLLNTILKVPPMPAKDLALIRSAERTLEAVREKEGVSRHLAEDASVRLCGPIWPIIDLTGVLVPETSKLHPFGPHKRKYIDREVEGEDGLDDDG